VEFTRFSIIFSLNLIRKIGFNIFKIIYYSLLIILANYS